MPNYSNVITSTGLNGVYSKIKSKAGTVILNQAPEQAEKSVLLGTQKPSADVCESWPKTKFMPLLNQIFENQGEEPLGLVRGKKKYPLA